MCPETAPSPELYFETIWAHQRSAALKSALDLDVFTAIADGGHTVREIADARAVPERGIRILCDYLTTLGFLTKGGDRYELTPHAALFLSRRSPAYLGGTADFLLSPRLLEYHQYLTDTIRRGAVQSDGMVEEENRDWVLFARAMMPMMMPAAHAIADLLDAASAGSMHVLDIAAGHGIFGIVVAQRNPAAEITAVDWAPVLEVASENARAMGVGERHRTLAGNALTINYGGGYDVALVTNFLHHFDRRTNVEFLRKVAGSLKDGGRVLVLEFVPNEDRVTPPMPARFALTMLATTPQGDTYTFNDLRALLAESGFKNATGHPLDGPQTVVIGVK